MGELIALLRAGLADETLALLAGTIRSTPDPLLAFALARFKLPTSAVQAILKDKNGTLEIIDAAKPLAAALEKHVDLVAALAGTVK